MGFKAVHFTQVEVEDVKADGFEGVRVRWLISKKDGAQNFAMRYFEISPGGQSAFHSHDWEHEVFILKGEGLVVCGNEERKVSVGYVVFIPPNIPHSFKNTGEETLGFLCLVPYKE